MPAVDANTVINTLTIAAGLALGVERAIELLKLLMDSAKGSLGKKELKELIDRAQRAVAEVKAAMAGGSAAAAAPSVLPAPVAAAQPVAVAAAVPTSVVVGASEQYPPPPIPVIPPTPLSAQQTGRQLFYLLFAAGMGIILAHIFEIRMLALLTVNNGLTGPTSPLFSFADLIFSGLVIGGGSQPIHVLITFLVEREVQLAKETATESKPADKNRPLAEVIGSGSLVEDKKETAALQWKDIVYQGGVNPAALQAIHLRPGDPNLVVYHHTAMASSRSFQEIVDEFLVNKKWVTGYHCVIMPDGEIKPFCRWDRAGNHALGHNARSLGISFHGNFHTAPGDKFSNADGRYGNQRPTDAQLHAGARVVALWVYLYPEIALDFEQCILPHKELMPGHTVCPGSNFSYDEFKQLTRQYHQAWMASPEAQQKLAAFKHLEYVYLSRAEPHPAASSAPLRTSAMQSSSS